jgi:hypothetical protein
LQAERFLKGKGGSVTIQAGFGYLTYEMACNPVAYFRKEV